MRDFLNSNWWTFALTFTIQFVLFARWLYRRIRDDELTRAFLQDMAANHLPHIYDLLDKMCDRQGIDRPPPPPIRLLDLLDGRDRRR
ncbi:MAG: hypothetical protein WB559_15150 [Candidatus Acidiferrales bacterium]